MKSQAERVLQSMDIVTREEFEAVKVDGHEGPRRE